MRRQAQFPENAFDIYRLLRAIATAETAKEFGLMQSHEISSRVTSEELSTIQGLFGSRSDMGIRLLVSSVRPVEDPAFIIESGVVLGQDLLEADGWGVMTVWECELRDIEDAERRLVAFLG